MAKQSLSSVGITFIDEDKYNLIHPDHLKSFDSEKQGVEILYQNEIKAAKNKAAEYAANMADKDFDEVSKKAYELYFRTNGKIAQDPVYGPTHKKYLAAREAYSKFLMASPPVGMISGAIEKNLKKKEYETSVPNEALLNQTVNKYASGPLADYCKVLPYYNAYHLLELNENRDKEWNRAERDFYRSNPQVMAGIERLKKVTEDIKLGFRQKRFTERFAPLSKQIEAKYKEERKKAQNKISKSTNDETEEILSLIKKLCSAPGAMDTMVDHAYKEFKKRDNGMDKGVHVSTIHYTVQYSVTKDRIIYYYESKYTNPLSSFVFEENNYKLLTSEAQCCAVALVLGQYLTWRLQNDPVYEMASITASGNYALINFEISYPNMAHKEAISLF